MKEKAVGESRSIRQLSSKDERAKFGQFSPAHFPALQPNRTLDATLTSRHAVLLAIKSLWSSDAGL